jgi:Family of unknown function (DUF6074)
MTETSAVAQLVREARHKLRPASAPRDARLHVQIAPPVAKVLLLRGRFRDANYIRTHVGYVVDMGAERGEQHIVRNLACIRRNLEEMGVDRDVIDREVRSIEAAVRAELWRQILLPAGDA